MSADELVVTASPVRDESGRDLHELRRARALVVFTLAYNVVEGVIAVWTG